MRLVWRLCPTILLFASLGSAASQEGPKVKKFLTKPLVIEDQGSFFIGGVPKVTYQATVPVRGAANQAPVPSQITIGQMYVQFQIPQSKKRNMPPVIMVHGSSHTAACLESTPDGREGWYPYFVRKGISTYLVDQAGRGRSGFDESVILEAAAMIKNGDIEHGLPMIPPFGRITDNGAWTNWFGQLTPPGSTILTGKLIRHGDPSNDDPRHTDGYFPAYPLGAVDENIVARTGAIAEAPAGPNELPMLWVLQAVGPQFRGDASGLHLRHLRSQGDRSGQYLDPAGSRVAGRKARGSDCGDALAVGNHGASHGPHFERKGSSGYAERLDYDRGVVLFSQQRAHS